MGNKGPNADDIASLEFDLVDSAMAFLTRSVQTMGDASCGDHTAAFAIADLATSVEVAMKARLLRHDWTQVCISPTKWSFNDLKNGSAKTVSLDEAVDRLDMVTGVDMTAYRSPVKSFARLRNRAVHLTLTNQGEQPVGVQAEYGRALSFMLSFLNSEFRDLGISAEITGVVNDVVETLTTRVGHIRALVDARMTMLSDELCRAAVRLTCPRCDQAALRLEAGGPPRCAFCLWSPDDGSIAAEEYVDIVLGRSRYQSAQDGEPYPIGFCLHCGVEAHVEGLKSVTDETPDLLEQMHGDILLPAYWGCFSCGETANSTELERCSRCETVTNVSTGRGVPICADCFAALVSSD